MDTESAIVFKSNDASQRARVGDIDTPDKTDIAAETMVTKLNYELNWTELVCDNNLTTFIWSIFNNIGRHAVVT